jgi:hypothetical protein
MKRESLQIEKSEIGNRQLVIFHRKSDAKKFFVEKITLEAASQGVSLSAPEQYMLFCSEEDPDFETDSAQEDAFENENNVEDFERRVCRLLKSAYARDKQLDSGMVRNWGKAFSILDKDNDYIQKLVATAIPRLARPFAQELRDFSLYVAIALSLIGAMFFYVTYIPPDADLRWYGLAGCSIFIFGFALFICQDYFRHRRFWLTFAGALVIHTVLWIRELSRPGDWDLHWFLLICLYEGAGVLALLYIIGEGKLKAIQDFWR